MRNDLRTIGKHGAELIDWDVGRTIHMVLVNPFQRLLRVCLDPLFASPFGQQAQANSRAMGFF